VDEIHLERETVDTKNGSTLGNVDLGDGPEDDTSANEAWVHMLTSLDENEDWKVPVGYYLIDSLEAEQRANLILETISEAYESNCIVTALTSDGPSVNKKTFEILGAVMDPIHKTPYFFHPNDPEIKIYCFIDPPHGLKCIRNNWSRNKFYSEKGVIDFDYIKKLHEYQRKLNLNIGNKLTNNHVHFKNVAMCVKFASETLSNSVANSLQYLLDLGKK
jgi:hypothetical protein